MLEPRYLVAYARLVIDKHANPAITLHGDTIYFGGLADTLPHAERQARDIVNKASIHARSTVLPKIFPLNGLSLLESLMEAQGSFEQLLGHMNDTALTVDWSFKK